MVTKIPSIIYSQYASAVNNFVDSISFRSSLSLFERVKKVFQAALQLIWLDRLFFSNKDIKAAPIKIDKPQEAIPVEEIPEEIIIEEEAPAEEIEIPVSKQRNLFKLALAVTATISAVFTVLLIAPHLGLTNQVATPSPIVNNNYIVDRSTIFDSEWGTPSLELDRNLQFNEQEENLDERVQFSSNIALNQIVFANGTKETVGYELCLANYDVKSIANQFVRGYTTNEKSSNTSKDICEESKKPIPKKQKSTVQVLVTPEKTNPSPVEVKKTDYSKYYLVGAISALVLSITGLFCLSRKRPNAAIDNTPANASAPRTPLRGQIRPVNSAQRQSIQARTPVQANPATPVKARTPAQASIPATPVKARTPLIAERIESTPLQQSKKPAIDKTPVKASNTATPRRNEKTPVRPAAIGPTPGKIALQNENQSLRNQIADLTRQFEKTPSKQGLKDKLQTLTVALSVAERENQSLRDQIDDVKKQLLKTPSKQDLKNKLAFLTDALDEAQAILSRDTGMGESNSFGLLAEAQDLDEKEDREQDKKESFILKSPRTPVQRILNFNEKARVDDSEEEKDSELTITLSPAGATPLRPVLIPSTKENVPPRDLRRRDGGKAIVAPGNSQVLYSPPGTVAKKKPGKAQKAATAH